MQTDYGIRCMMHIAKADFLQRIRSYDFLIALGACVFAIYSFVPPVNAGYTIISLGNYRGLYNAAWIGCMVAICVPFFTLVGFYLINSAVQRDIDTGVGQIIATTRVTKLQYLYGKLISNLGVLTSILLVIAFMTVVMFFVRGESGAFEPGNLFLPLLIITFPSLVIISALAVSLESLSGLSRGLINIAYFFLWIFFVSGGLLSPITDIFGLDACTSQITGAVRSAHPDWNGHFGTGILIIGSRESCQVFTWEGMQWTSGILFQRVLCMAAALLLIPLASLRFSRFESQGEKEYKAGKKHRVFEKPDVPDAGLAAVTLRYIELPKAGKAFSFLKLARAELTLLLKGRPRIWMILTASLFLASAIVPADTASRWILPLLWYFQVLILSGTGCRETRNRCEGYVFSSSSPLKRQLPAAFAASFLFMLALSLPMVARTLITGNSYSAFSIIAASAFIPAFAIASGVLTGGSKLFEVLFTVLTYCSLSAVPFFDLTGYSADLHNRGIAGYLVILTSALIVITFLARKKQIRQG
jgi:hypothetical protein